ncbi:hypothetical protein Syun_004446 [Stephania yunnanensis]|uniref:Response regulatory domain-containing protein n=1 Tax=Stephania yunnanensis TaxID=152371 RepID=A0AAP0L775_9MAGN
MDSSSINKEKLHVLAVDDSEVERAFMEKFLKNCDCQVTTAENGARAMEYLSLENELRKSKKSKVNMIITDHSMPEMTGYELLKKVKESSTMKDIPVVIVSSDNIPTLIKKCLEEGAKEFMLKSLQQSDKQKLRSHLKEFQQLIGK